MLKQGEQLNAMLVLAVTRHSGQKDKAGRPYILHTLAVMHKLRTDDEELNCIAVGHDLVEDTGTTFAELKEKSLIDARAQAADQAADFSERVRAGLPSFD